jgi:endonuclease YncB( thermonuclease family)
MTWTHSSTNGRSTAHRLVSTNTGARFAVCSIDGVDLAEWLVRNGLALDWPTYSKGKYDKAQREAEHAGRGMWAGSYVEPWLFRACIRQGGKPGECSDDANSHP